MNKGFSLVELIVVIAIMAVLAGVAVPVYSAYTENAKEGVDENYAAEIWHAAEVAGALEGVEFDKIEIAPSGAFTIYKGQTNINDATDDDSVDFMTSVNGVVTKKQALESKEYKNGMSYTSAGPAAATVADDTTDAATTDAP